MIPLDAEIFVSIEPVDLRVSFDALAGLVRERFGAEPKAARSLSFSENERKSSKQVFTTRTDTCILYKRLCRGTFRIPTPERQGDTSSTLSASPPRAIELPEELFFALLEGLLVESREPNAKKSTPQLH